jgi:hypothetical protein
MTMKKQYIQPQMSVVEVKPIGNLMIGSTVSDKDFDANNMDALGRESVWGNNEDQTEESKFWF